MDPVNVQGYAPTIEQPSFNPRMSESEQKALCEHPQVLCILADWHDYEQQSADESTGGEAFHTNGNEIRAKQLRAQALRIVQADPLAWDQSVWRMAGYKPSLENGK